MMDAFSQRAIDDQHGPNQKSGLNAGAREGKAVTTS
jgi:hypothetical protein